MERKYIEQNNFTEEDRYLRAKKRVKQIQGFIGTCFGILQLISLFG